MISHLLLFNQINALYSDFRVLDQETLRFCVFQVEYQRCFTP